MTKMNPDEQRAYDEGLQRIEACRRKGKRGTVLTLSSLGLSKLPPEINQLVALTQLNLTSNRLLTLPPEIGQLRALQALFLGHNHLKELPREIGQLTVLTGLFLHNNELSALPREISQLTALTTLTLDVNQFTALPREIGQFRTLTRLGLSYNKIKVLPAEIGQFVALTRLNLSNNSLTTLPAEIGRMAMLTELNLSENQLTTLLPQIGQLIALKNLFLSNNRLTILPPQIGQLTAVSELHLQDNRLTQLPPSLQQLKRLQNLLLHGNPRLKLSPIILGGDPRKVETNLVSAKSILDYYFGRQLHDSQPLNEVKVILVGRGGAGKTSTVRALRGLSFEEKEASTPGIALCDWKLEGCRDEPVTAHMWDFAGQVITHALHQFFFSVRSVYVLVLTGRENSEREDAEYWLRLIRAFGTDDAGQGPPVIVALNKWDLPGCRPKVDRRALQERYPFIRGFVEMDCTSKKRVVALNKALCREVSRLKWIREPFPQEWAAVRQALNPKKLKRAHLTYGEFRMLCTNHGVMDSGEQDSLSEILHNLGAALNYRNDPRLREATVLQPEWLTRNVYALVRRAEKQAGVLRQADVDAVLAKEKDAKMRAYLVQIMERFEIAYPSRAAGGGVWLVPQALPDEQPKGVEVFRAATDATQLRYTYTALPEGLVARAIVRLHEFIEEVKDRPQQWASGAVLAREGARALIRTETPLQVMITVTGPKKVRQQLAGLCQAEMRDINREIRGLEPVEETNVQGVWVETDVLEADERNQQKTGIRIPKKGTVLVDPQEPNDAYSEKPARQEEIWKPTVFISYSKSNVAQRKSLESQLKILGNEGLLDRHWHDRMIDPGDEWDETIQRELSEADVIVVLVSSDALATDYIRQHEIPKALELHKAGKTVVIPVVLEACRWDQTALEPLNALPEKGKPLNKWAPRPDGWKSVADGLAKVFKKLMTKGPQPGRRTSVGEAARSRRFDAGEA